MKRREPKPDPRQGSLFVGSCRGCTPEQRVDCRPTGSLQCDPELREALSQALAECSLSREQIAAEMERLVGADPDYPISKAMLDAWTAASRHSWRFPLIYLPALVAVTGAHWLLDLIAARCERVVVTSEEARNIELGRVKREMQRLRQRERELLKRA